MTKSKQKETSSNNDSQKKETKTQQLIQLVKNARYSLFMDQHRQAYARVPIPNGFEIIRIKDGDFRDRLTKLYYDKYHDVVGNDAISSVISLLVAGINIEANICKLQLRVAWGKPNEEIYYDLTDKQWRCVKITKNYWSVIPHPSALFTRYMQLPQVEPDSNYPPNVFDVFLDLSNVKGDQNRLVTKVFIAALLVPEIPHPIDVTHGEKGSAKSTFCTLVKETIDPDASGLLSLPTTREELNHQLRHHYLLAYDNVSGVTFAFSDEICRAVTGSGISKRKLYSDDEEFVYQLRRCFIFNGINPSLTQSDALDRSIMTRLFRISDSNRIEDSEIKQRFYDLRPKLLGYLFDVLSKALTIKDTVKLSKKPRMADFAVWGEAIARAMGYQPCQFLNAYRNILQEESIEAVAAHPLGSVIMSFVEELEKHNQTKWSGSAIALLNDLNKHMDRNRIFRDRRFPTRDNILSRQLNQIRSNLLDAFKIQIDNARDKTNRAIITIEKLSIHTTGASTSPSAKLSPTIPLGEYSQKRDSGDTGDIGDTISSKEEKKYVDIYLELEGKTPSKVVRLERLTEVINNVKGSNEDISCIVEKIRKRLDLEERQFYGGTSYTRKQGLSPESPNLHSPEEGA